jgi:hypothetical protein
MMFAVALGVLVLWSGALRRVRVPDLVIAAVVVWEYLGYRMCLKIMTIDV